MRFQTLPLPLRFAAIFLLTVGIGFLDWRTGFYVNVLAFFALPIVLGVLALGNGGGLAIWLIATVTCVGARRAMGNAPHLSVGIETWNGLMRTVTLFLFYLGASAVRFRLETMQARLRQLTGLLPLCGGCQKIRDEYGYWDDLETYLREHTELDVERKLCPDCSKRLSAESAPAPPPRVSRAG